MADLSITATNVLVISGTPSTKKAGENITAGELVYPFNSTHMKLAVNTNATVAAISGIALNNATTGQCVSYLGAGTIALGAASVTVGETYCVSNTSGKICPIADIGSGENLTYFGYGATTANITISIEATGLSKA